MSPRLSHILSLAVVAFVGACVISGPSTLSARDQVKRFKANRVCIIHADANSVSASLGRLKIGESALVLEEPSTTKWIKVDFNGVQGWVYSPRGTISSVEHEPPTMKFYFGNLHAHTGELSQEGGVSNSTHEEAFQYAMDDEKGNLDFMAITVHNHLVEEEAYGLLRGTTQDTNFNKPGKFAPIAGHEFSSISQGNHINVFELDAWINPSEVANGAFDDLFLSFIPGHETDYTFAQFNHPYSSDFTAKGGKEYGRDDFASMKEWIDATDPYVQAIEVISTGSHKSDTDRPHYNQNNTRLNAWLWALNEGWHLGPTANQDNHKKNWGSGSDARTVVVAPELTRHEILTALKSRRFYASEDSTMQVTFRAGDSWMGSIIAASDFSHFTVKVEDPGETSANYFVRVYGDYVGGEALKHNSDPELTMELANGEEAQVELEEIEGGTYYFLKVYQSKTADDHNDSADEAWTAPIWLVGDLH